VKVKCFKPPGKKYSETEVMPRGKSSPLSTNTGSAKQWLGNIPDVSKMFELKSADELSKIVNDWINNGMPDGSDGTPRGGHQVAAAAEDEETPTPQKRKSPGDNFRSIDDAFADLIDS